ncbi:ubiquitin carboxyl-terminal hydrolase 2-like isoform X3 [Hyposmocoma kahamanoa]|uniref:ubiquitin carboxyl-terminal hydrolase 2-like isoform X3 n=1 Tax=Hyposmocoma kahamanoa TaxID=1477025 RepID=UPI000E6D9D74|nr:ubiquitin carboxyl-terminal hydrolase 2-like isoform X3 [Hyposmocoma kahamanoa]
MITMPVVSPSRYNSASSSHSGSYRSTLTSTSSLDKPYYRTTGGTYVTSTFRTSLGDRTTEYRSRFSDIDGKKERNTSLVEYTRTSRAPSVTDSDSGISTRYRSERSESRSRDISTTRSESSKTTSDPLPRNKRNVLSSASLAMSTADLYNKYSPANYIPLTQRIQQQQQQANQNSYGEISRSKSISNDIGRPPASDSSRLRKARNSTAATIIEELAGGKSGAVAGRRSSERSDASTDSRIDRKPSHTSGLNGLRNIGNTCFMNSVLQCLSNTRPLLEYVSEDKYTSEINTTLSCMKGALIKAFASVVKELWRGGERDAVVNTTSLKAQVQRFAPRFMGYSQQDAQEFLRYLLEGLHEDVNRVTAKPKPILAEIDDGLSDSAKAAEAWSRYLRMEDSRVGDIFVGQLKSTLRCTHCNHDSVTFDPFWDLSLPIPSRTGNLKLQQCLAHFTREEEMDGDEKPTCSKCGVRRKCLKWFTVHKFPQVLVLHLKRFSPTERFRGKLNVLVEFPLTGLDMSPYAAARQASPVYNLYAVSNHSGTTYSGHYTAYCKHPYTGDWHEYNDSRVTPISPRNVVSSEAYVLFYELARGSHS